MNFRKKLDWLHVAHCLKWRLSNWSFVKVSNQINDEYVTEGKTYNIVPVNRYAELKHRLRNGDMSMRICNFTYYQLPVCHTFFFFGGGGGAFIFGAEKMRNLWKFFIAYPTFLSVLRWYGQCLQLGDAVWLLPQT